MKVGIPSPLHNPPMRVYALPHKFVYSLNQMGLLQNTKIAQNLGHDVGEGLVPSRLCENAEHFLASFFQLSGGASPSLTGYARILQHAHLI